MADKAIRRLGLLFLGILLLGGPTGCRSARNASAPNFPPGTARLSIAPDQFFQSDRSAIRYRDIGEGEPVVLIHGYAGSLTWFSDADSLALDHRVISMDLRGFGQSTKFVDPSEFGIQMVNDIIRLLGHLNLERAHLVGYSMGALLATNIAKMHPDRVASLSLIAGGFWPDSATARAALAPWINGLKGGQRLRPTLKALYPLMTDSAATEISERLMAQNDSSSLVAVLHSLPSLMLSPANLQRLDASFPILIVGGTGDPLWPFSLSLAEAWTRERLVEVPNATHGSILTQPILLQELRSIFRDSRQ